MTMVRVSTTRTKGPAKHDCGCGCGGTGGSCCDLECLVRPNFYCGQLLTDADLSAVVQWTRDRLALSRFRDGWGVVCGLEVTCSEPEGACGCGCGSPKGCTVWIGKGYAVDCCGNDLVVCEPIPVDLGSVCRPNDDPCADPCWPPITKDPQQVGRAGQPRDIVLGDLQIKGEDQLIVDLYLTYAEQPAAGQRPLFRGSCADVDACEPSRLLERPAPKLVVRALASPYEEVDASEDEITRLTKGYTDLTKRLDTLFENANLRTLTRRLSAWRLHSICLVMDYVRTLHDLDSDIIARIRSWLQLDWLMHEGLCECRPCRTDDGVRLARLWLWRKDGRFECCRPLEIFSIPPFRRMLQRDCQPIGASKVDLRKWLGAPAGDDVVDKMKRQGIQVQGIVDHMEHRLQQPLFTVPASDPLHVYTVEDPFGTRRIFGFDTANA